MPTANFRGTHRLAGLTRCFANLFECSTLANRRRLVNRRFRMVFRRKGLARDTLALRNLNNPGDLVGG